MKQLMLTIKKNIIFIVTFISPLTCVYGVLLPYLLGGLDWRLGPPVAHM